MMLSTLQLSAQILKMALDPPPVTPESILRAQIAAEAERRFCAKRVLLTLVDEYGLAVVQRWLDNVRESYRPSPSTINDPRR